MTGQSVGNEAMQFLFSVVGDPEHLPLIADGALSRAAHEKQAYIVMGNRAARVAAGFAPDPEDGMWLAAKSVLLVRLEPGERIAVAKANLGEDAGSLFITPVSL